MPVDYSNLAKNPDAYVDISNLAKGPFNLSDLRSVQPDQPTPDVEPDSDVPDPETTEEPQP